MVASTHWLASASGMAVLEAGGNAFDAAVAAGLVLHVVEPHLNGLGGDMPLLARAADGRAFVVCGQGTTPAAATLGAFTDLGLSTVPGTGPLAWVERGDPAVGEVAVRTRGEHRQAHSVGRKRRGDLASAAFVAA